MFEEIYKGKHNHSCYFNHIHFIKMNLTFKQIKQSLRGLGLAELFKLSEEIALELYRRKLRLITLRRIDKNGNK